MMNPKGKEILVTGATGAQGGAVVRHLMSRGWGVRALTRDPDKPAARKLAENGVRVVRGDQEDRRSLDEAVEGAYGVFSVQNFWDGFPARVLGAEGEVRQGKNLADAAKAARVEHFVQTTAAGAIRSGLKHVDSKRDIEDYARQLELPMTLIRPVFFMDNFNTEVFGMRQQVMAGRLALPLAPNRRLQMVATEDIGYFAALAFERPEDFIGTSFDLAGDQPTMPEAAAIFSRVLGREIRFVGDPAHIQELRKVSPELAGTYAAFNARTTEVLIAALRALHPGMWSFETFLRKTGWEQATTG